MHNYRRKEILLTIVVILCSAIFVKAAPFTTISKERRVDNVSLNADEMAESWIRMHIDEASRDESSSYFEKNDDSKNSVKIFRDTIPMGNKWIVNKYCVISAEEINCLEVGKKSNVADHPARIRIRTQPVKISKTRKHSSIGKATESLIFNDIEDYNDNFIDVQPRDRNELLRLKRDLNLSINELPSNKSSFRNRIIKDVCSDEKEKETDRRKREVYSDYEDEQSDEYEEDEDYTDDLGDLDSEKDEDSDEKDDVTEEELESEEVKDEDVIDDDDKTESEDEHDKELDKMIEDEVTEYDYTDAESNNDDEYGQGEVTDIEILDPTIEKDETEISYETDETDELTAETDDGDPAEPGDIYVNVDSEGIKVEVGSKTEVEINGEKVTNNNKDVNYRKKMKKSRKDDSKHSRSVKASRHGDALNTRVHINSEEDVTYQYKEKTYRKKRKRTTKDDSNPSRSVEVSRYENVPNPRDHVDSEEVNDENEDMTYRKEMKKTRDDDSKPSKSVEVSRYENVPNIRERVNSEEVNDESEDMTYRKEIKKTRNDDSKPSKSVEVSRYDDVSNTRHRVNSQEVNDSEEDVTYRKKKKRIRDDDSNPSRSVEASRSRYEDASYDWHRCALPRKAKNAEILCKKWNTAISCNMYCAFGHRFKGDIKKQIKCRFSEGRWSGKFEECKPFLDCTLQLKSAGTLSCITNRLKKGTQCEVSCARSETGKAVSKKSYTCTNEGRWLPELPHCVESEGIELEDPPKSYAHSEIEYPKKYPSF